MKLLLTAAAILTLSGAAIAETDYVHLSFQDNEQYASPASQPATGSADLDYVHLSFQDNEEQYYDRTASQTEIGGSSHSYVNEIFDGNY